VHIRDDLELKPNGYRITLKGVESGLAEAQPGMYLAINPGRVMAPLAGTQTRDPAFGLPAVWIDAAMREQAQVQGYTVVDAATVIATHLNQVIRSHAAELLGRNELQQLLDHLAKDSPKLVEEVVPKLLPLATLQRVLQNLLEEGMHIRDIRSIMEILAAHAGRTQDAAELTSLVRVALSRSIVQQIYGPASELQVIALEPGLERLLTQAVATTQGDATGIEPGLADTLVRETATAAEQQEAMGLPSVLLVPTQLRVPLSRFLRRAVPNLKLISHAEIPDSRNIKVTSIVGGRA
jgi:flagellar biosynthesis protein FlhA